MAAAVAVAFSNDTTACSNGPIVNILRTDLPHKNSLFLALESTFIFSHATADGRATVSQYCRLGNDTDPRLKRTTKLPMNRFRLRPRPTMDLW